MLSQHALRKKLLKLLPKKPLKLLLKKPWKLRPLKAPKLAWKLAWKPAPKPVLKLAPLLVQTLLLKPLRLLRLKKPSKLLPGFA